MSNRQSQAYELRSSLEPRIINRSPVVIERTPEDPLANRPSSEPKLSRSRTVWSLHNPLRRHRHHSSVIVTDRTRTSVTTHKRGASDGTTSLSYADTFDRSGRTSSPTLPAIVQERSSRSLSPFSRSRMPTQGSANWVPLPPKVPPQERQRDDSRGNDSGRESRQSRQSEATEEIVRIIEEPDRSRREPRPYRSHANPFETHEQVVPTSPRPRQETENFEVVQPNETVRSRQRNNDVLNSKEYLQMKEIAHRNYEAAKDAIERCSRAEVSIQNLQHDLAAMTTQANKANEISDKLRNELEKHIEELEKRNRELKDMYRDKHISVQQAQLAQDQLDLERQRMAEQQRELRRDKERHKDQDTLKDDDNDGSGSGSGRRRRRHHHRVVKVHQEGDQRDSQPRTPDPRASGATTAGATAGTTGRTGTTGGSGMDAIKEAIADAARRRVQ